VVKGADDGARQSVIVSPARGYTPSNAQGQIPTGEGHMPPQACVRKAPCLTSLRGLATGAGIAVLAYLLQRQKSIMRKLLMGEG